MDILKWTDTEYETLTLRESSYDRTTMLNMENEEAVRHDELESTLGSGQAGHSKFMSGQVSGYVDSITTVSKHAENIFENIGYGVSTETQQASVKYLPKVEVGSKAFSEQQDAIIRKQHDERAQIRGELMKLRGHKENGNEGHDLIRETMRHETMRDRDYHIDRKALRGLAKEMVWGKQEAASPRRDSTMGGKLPTMSTMGRRKSFGKIPHTHLHGEQKDQGGETWKNSSAPETKRKEFVAPSPKLKFLRTAHV